MADPALIIPEELLLLALDDATGQVDQRVARVLDIGLASSSISELALKERLEVEGEKVLVTDEAPVGHPVLDDVLRTLMLSGPRAMGSWISGRLSKDMGGLRERLLDGLAERGILERKVTRRLLIFPVRRYYVRDEAARAAVRARVDQVFQGGDKGDMQTFSLALMVKIVNLIGALYPGEERAVTARFDQLLGLSSPEPTRKKGP